MRTAFLSGSLLLSLPLMGWSNPSGGTVVHGGVTIESLDQVTTILQSTDKGIINWQDFSIQAGELTRFVQPGTSSATLNRVISGNPSAIHGQLQANGRVFLINPNGILVGPGGQIDTAGFIASGLDLPDADFLADGDLHFAGGEGAVTNLGTILARDGDVFLVGTAVSNAGTISAPNGAAGLAAGSAVTIRKTGDERLFIEGGSVGGVDHTGSVEAAMVEMKADSAAGVNVSGIVAARGVERKGGQIFLRGGRGPVAVNGQLRAENGGRVEVTGQRVEITQTAEIDASGEVGGSVVIDSESETKMLGRIDASGTSGAGGTVSVTGKQVTIGEGAVIEASGTTGGGEIFAGGGFQGGDPALRNAETTTIGSGARFNVAAAQSGDAGRVIVWADGATAFGGHIDATANGSDGGAGGFVEVSGKQTLQYRGSVDLRSESGPNGTLLLDPTRIIIIDGPAGVAADSAQVADGVILGTDGGAADFTITTGDIAAVGGNVRLQATTEVTDNGANLSVSVDGDFAVSAGGNINLGGTDITANGHQVTFVSSAGGVSFNTIDTSGFLPGDDGGDVTIFAGSGDISGNGVNARGADGGLGDANGGNGGNIVMDDLGGGNAISFGMIDNSGGNGADGTATTPGGNGGDGGFISFGNTSGNSSSFGPAPPIIYGGGNGGNGHPPGSGGLGGEAFFNNGTIIPDNVAPDGQSGTDLAGSGNSGGGISMAPNPNRGSGLGGGNFIGINNDIANPTAPFDPNRNFSATHIQPERDREEVEFGSEEFQDLQIDNAIRESRRKREDKRNALMLMVVAKAAGEGGIANIDLEGGINAMQDIDPEDIKVILQAAGGEVTFGPNNEDGSGTIVATVGDKAVIGTVTHNDDGTISVTGAKAVDLKTAEGRALVESVKSSLEVPAADGGGFFGDLLRQHENRGGATNGGN